LILQNLPAVYLASSVLLIAVLHLLRSRMRRREVATLRLWEGLQGDPHARTIRLKQLIDPLLFLQLLTLLALVLAAALPSIVTRIRGVSDLAVVIDGSASMQTIAQDAETRYALAISEARSILSRFGAPSVTVVQLTSRPTVLGTPEGSRADAVRALNGSEATWSGDGGLTELSIALTPHGGLPSFDRVLLITDREFGDLPEAVEQVVIGGGENRGIVAFSVREDPIEPGAVAFVEIRNPSSEYADVTIQISDGIIELALPEVLPPNSSEVYVFPFPESRGTTFSVRLLPEDAFAADDARYFALDRPLSLRVRWLGEKDPYVLAALRAVVPITLTSSGMDADLTVVHKTSVPATMTGNLLLLHAEIPGRYELGAMREGGPVAVAAHGHPLTEGIDPASIRVFDLPEMSVPNSATVVLTSGDAPLLTEESDAERAVFALAPDLMTTNLPVTVDFPLLIQRILSRVTRLPAGLSFGWSQVGAPVDLSGLGTIRELLDPDGEAVDLRTGQSSFLPALPGHYTLETDRGLFPIAVNVPAGESDVAAVLSGPEVPLESGQLTHGLLALWPYITIVALLALVAEGILRDRLGQEEGRTP